MADVESLRNHAVIDGDVPDDTLQMYLDAAVRYFKNAGVEEPEEDDALYDLGVYQLAAFYYDRRIPIGAEIAGEKLPYGVNGIILQLREGW